MDMARTTLVFLLLLGPLAGCAAGSAPGAGSRDQDIITAEEIAESRAQTALDLIQQLRPRWAVRSRGERTFVESAYDYPRVVVDDLPPREFDSLREIPKEVLVEIRFLNPREATLLYGTGHTQGVIRVTTKR
jgi:hypothetical protein